MKKIQLIKKLVLTLVIVLNIGCVNDDEITIAPFPREIIFKETFDSAVNNAIINLPGWTNFSEVGTKKWLERMFSRNGYAQFSAFQSGEAINVSWLVTPKIETKGYDSYLFAFSTAKFFLDEDSDANTITAYYSTNYDGINVTNANWVKIEPINIPKKSAANYTFLASKFEFPINGNIHFAFKYVGSGLPNSTLDGGFQIDNVFVYGLL
jgi:hypothetical protein